MGDPLIGSVVDPRMVGYVSPVPLHPELPPVARPAYGLAGLVRGIDRGARRHVYGVGATPPGEVVGELGAVATDDHEGTMPLVRLPDGRLATPWHHHAPAPPRATAAVRWTLAPARWRRFGHLGARGRALARRAAIVAAGALRNGRGPADGPRDVVGHVFVDAADGRVPLYSGLHPVTGDQLLTRYRIEALAMGYVDVALLGYLLPVAPVTGTLEWRRQTVPWASRFGLEAPWT
jgi:hypothetical protein